MASNRRRVAVRWQGGYRTDIDVRGVHHLVGDETPEYGGEDSGPMPTELLLASIGTCMCLAVVHVARKRRIALGEVNVDVGADKDMQAFRFREIFLTVHADLPQGELEPLVEMARNYCFVSNTLAAGCSIHTVARSTVEQAVGLPPDRDS